ncbi:MAG: beta-propeller fold lactonase family protein [Armatimonadetes bacterium]|nr:beta-propeller fold lactonase family protein [Armatimonadota bacterium]
MKNWMLILGVGVVGLMALTGCGGGGSVLAPVSAEYRLAAITNSGGFGLYKVTSAGLVTELFSGSGSSQYASIVEGVNANDLYFSFNNNSNISLVKFMNDAPFSSGNAATAGGSGSLLFLHPTRSMLYALLPNQSKIDQFAISPDGSLTVQPQADADAMPVDMVFNPNGNYAYVVSKNSKVVRVYAIDADGTLSLIPGAAYPTAINPAKIVITDDGANLYAMGQDQDISQFAIGANGLLTPLAPQKASYPMGNFRAAMTANNVLSFYREADEGIETLGRTGGGQLSNLGAPNYVTSATTDIYRLPGQNLLFLLARGTGSGQTVSMGSNGIGTQLSTSSLLPGVSDVALWQVP